MTLLNSLKLVSAKRTLSLPPLVQRRNKLSKKLWEQIQLAQAKVNGTDYAPTQYKTVINHDTGEKREIKVPKRIKNWWWVNDRGHCHVSIFYGNKVVELAKGKSSVELADQAELIPTLELLKQAVEAGELDAAIEAVSGQLRSTFKK